MLEHQYTSATSNLQQAPAATGASARGAIKRLRRQVLAPGEPLIQGIFLSAHAGYNSLATTRKIQAEYDHDSDMVLARIVIRQSDVPQKNNIATRLNKVREQIDIACKNAGRDPASVNLLAVSKTQDIASCRSALDAGQRDLGENYLQEALAKVAAVPTVSWHFIGSIQSNKTKDIANHFSWVHSVASEKIARRLSDQRHPTLGPLNILIQVNVSGEQQKSGVAPEQLSELVSKTSEFKGVRLRGLMTIPEASQDPGAERNCFRTLRELKNNISASFGLPHFDQLSMGMTADFPIAISEGATWVRIGTAIFGPRSANRHQRGCHMG